MKRSVLLGLFVTASMMASTSFAASKTDNLCETNIQTIENGKAQVKPEMQGQIEASLNKAKALLNKGDETSIKQCITETQQTMTELQKTNKDGKSS
ncbi:hypothetical protein [Pseudomonas sp. PDM04]|uniref:hypothetical protein n=1 Tax=Pseudomonas sp. PDM04 TaxID=2769296 RepID=UPI001783AF1D|nr:hypothetical protein [Pseudomonas sp. PDM04]MBD9443748.1 hypothetical protein [Pseudomonas sp. PDM04]